MENGFDTLISKQLRDFLPVKLNLSPQEIILRTNECVKMLKLMSEIPGPVFISCSVGIDEIWHLLILESKEYFELCKNIGSGKYLHHSSIRFEDFVDSEGGEYYKIQELTILASYIANFGSFTSETYGFWTGAAHYIDDKNWSLAELNKFLKNLNGENK